MTRYEYTTTMNKKHNGAYTTVQWYSNPTLSKLGKACNVSVMKLTTMVIRKGISYSHISTVSPKASRKLPWGHWDDEYPDTLINHNGKTYARLYTCPNTTNGIKTTYIVNGVPMSREKLMETGYVQPSYFNGKDSDPVCMNVPLDHITHIF